MAVRNRHRSSTGGRSSAPSSPLVPDALLEIVLDRLADGAAILAELGVTASAVTISRLVLAAIGGVLLAFGMFSWAAVAMAFASLGDALDGIVARRTNTSSVGGALLDASVDRYEEFLFLGGLAVHFRESVPAIVLALSALAGSFMVSYGSAKAEAAGVPVPYGTMRRPERAICLCVGVSLAAFTSDLQAHGYAPDWMGRAPIFVALGLIAVIANVSAISRLRRIAAG
jgi:CDP-diacylglycerol--glycerol-3-phosphate 3-phosphatidyltransferase